MSSAPARLELGAADLEAITAALPPARGERYGEAGMGLVGR